MGDAERDRDHRHDDRLPARGHEGDLRLHHAADEGPQSKEDFEFPVEYMFKDVPEKQYRDVDDPIAVTLHEMDQWGIEKGIIGVGDDGGIGELALKRHPDRFIPQVRRRPERGHGRRPQDRPRRTRRTASARSGMFPAGTFPQVAINDKKMYPIYAKCVELGIPVFCCAGVPGPAPASSSRSRSSSSTR